MSGLGTLLVVLSVGASAAVQIMTDRRINRRFVYRSLIAVAVYFAHCTIGLVAVLYLMPTGSVDSGLAAAAAIFGWIGLGVLGVIRFAPRVKEPPRFLLRVGPADAVCLCVIAAGLAWGAGVF